jgi:nicotinamide mononucleotide transporter
MIEAAGIIASLLGVYFSSQRKSMAWIWNIIASGIYMYVFYEAGLYSDMELQGIFMLMAAYGLYQWHREDDAWKPSKNNARQVIFGILIALSYGLVAGYLHERFTAAVKSPYWDATLTGLSILGTYWAAQRKIENWILWIFVDTVYVGLYVVNGLWGTAVLYIVFVFMAIYGWISWHNKLNIN